MKNEIYPCVEYARVSTANEGQKESCANQIMLCDAYVKQHPQYHVVERYIDDALTGGNDIRPEYQKMLSRIQEGDIRYIITKSTNRLCRSTEVDGQLLKICRAYDVMIIFVDGHQVFNPFNVDDVTMHSIQMIFDERYIHTQSKNGRIAHEQKCARKTLDATDTRYGYEWDYKNKCMVINEEEAIYVKKMFEWYVFGGLGVSEIADKLAEHGVYGQHSGKVIAPNVISHRLSDSSYMGVFHINKKGSKLNIGVGAKKIRFTRPEEEWVAVEGPAIITPELFALAEKVREERRRVHDKPSEESKQARFRGTHLFASKVFCGSCGTQFHFKYADRAKTIGEYKDYFSKKKKSFDDVCTNKNHNRIREDTLIEVCKSSINLFLSKHEQCVDNLVKVIREASAEATNDDTQIKALQKRLLKVNKELTKNLEAWRDAPDEHMKQDFLRMYQDKKIEQETLEKHITELESQKKTYDDIEQEIQQIKDKVEGLKQIQVIDRTVVDNFIERIIVYEDGKVAVILRFGSTFSAILSHYEPKDYPYWSGEGVSNIKFMNSLEDLKENILCYRLVSCSDRTRRQHLYRTCKQR